MLSPRRSRIETACSASGGSMPNVDVESSRSRGSVLSGSNF